MAHITHTVSFTHEGKKFSHTAEALRYWFEADGVVVVEAACCGMVGAPISCPNCPGPGCLRCGGSGQVKGEDTLSRHSFYDIARDTAAGPIDPEAEIKSHIQRVAEHHAASHRQRLTSLDSLVKFPSRGGK